MSTNRLRREEKRRRRIEIRDDCVRTPSKARAVKRHTMVANLAISFVSPTAVVVTFVIAVITLNISSFSNGRQCKQIRRVTKNSTKHGQCLDGRQRT